MTDKVVFLSAISSDIGIALARRYSRDGYVVAGTYRSTRLLDQLESIERCHLFYCDLNDVRSIGESARQFAALGLQWHTFISCASQPAPLCSFFAGEFEKWSQSVHVNSIEQLRVLHDLYPMRDRTGVSNAVFFAGPGTNNAVKNFSALTVSKLALIKMVELLAAENTDLNVFIVGPGWTRTKTHDAILNDPDVSPEKHAETREFMANHRGTSMDDIYDCIKWLSRSGREVASGRNFSVVHDCWGEESLAQELRRDTAMYTLRRCRNGWRQRGCDRA